MRRLLAALLPLALAAACSRRPPARTFELGLRAPVGPGVAAAARAEGLTIRDSAPDGFDELHAGVALAGPAGPAAERLADWAMLRLLVARAAVRGRAGVLFTLPRTTDARELTDFPEEWQALARVAREAAALRPILESGVDAPDPFPVPDGVEARAWRFDGRLYVLLVNDSGAGAPLPADALRPWRALFEVRADARELLVPCEDAACLPPGRALWLEGRL